MDLAKLQTEFTMLQNDLLLYVESNLHGREKALDYIDFVGEVARTRPSDRPLTALDQQARLLKTRLAEINTNLFIYLRTKIQMGGYTHAELRQQFNAFTTYTQGDQHQAHIGYDGLDVLISGLFEIEPPPQARQALTPDMVHYEPTPARVMLDLVDRVAFAPDDVFYDSNGRRIYMSGGDGNISVFDQTDADHYRFLLNVPTPQGARTSFFVPQAKRLYLAVPHRGSQPSEIRVYSVLP